jgi:hypothetical protein
VGAVLGLSLTADDVVWALVDADNGELLDHDALEFDTDSEIAGAAARGAEAIATAGGLAVDRVRLVWSDDVELEGKRLRSRLTRLCCAHVEAVPMACAVAAPVAEDAMDMAPRLALAYGAARAEVSLHEAMTVPLPLRPVAPRRTHRRIAAAVFGAAAAAVAAVFFVAAAGSEPQVMPAAATTDQVPAADPGWVTVSAPTDGVAESLRKVVPTPPPLKSTPKYYPVRPVVAAPLKAAPALSAPAEAAPVVSAPAEAAPVVSAPAEAAPVVSAPAEAAPAVSAPAEAALPAVDSEPAQVPHLETTGQSHLPGVQAPGPLPGPADAGTVPLPGPEMTDSQNLFTATP